MLKKILTSLLCVGFSLSGLAVADTITPLLAHSSHHHTQHSDSYALYSNQGAILDGDTILWDASSLLAASDNISIDVNGNITLPHGVFLIQYTVRVQKTPFDGTSTAVVQLQQTLLGVPTNVTQAAVTTSTSVDGLISDIPQSDSQITGYALVTVTSHCGVSTNNIINLNVSLSGGDTIPATSGTDANAQIAIIQIR